MVMDLLQALHLLQEVVQEVVDLVQVLLLARLAQVLLVQVLLLARLAQVLLEVLQVPLKKEHTQVNQFSLHVEHLL